MTPRYYLQTIWRIAIFDLRKEYVISLIYLKHICHNLLLMVHIEWT